MRQAVVREAAPGQGQGQGQGESLCAEGLATVVFIDAGYKPMRLPAEDRAVFEALRAAAAGEARDGGLNGNGK
jgi:acyl-CoA thioesterase FadM